VIAVLVGVVSAKGSPGATTAGLGIATRWPTGPGVLVEADPAGGDLAARFGLGLGPGLASMAVAARHTHPPPDPSVWTRVLPSGVRVVPAAPGGAAAAALTALAGQGHRLLSALADAYPVVVVDAGRWIHGSPADGLLSACQVVLLVTSSELEQISQCQARIGALRRLVGDVRLLLVQVRGGWPAGEVGAALGLPVAGALPVDGRGAGVLSGRLVPRNGWRTGGPGSWARLPLLRACHSLARTLTPAPTVGVGMPAAPAPGDPAIGGWVGPAREPAGARPPTSPHGVNQSQVGTGQGTRQ
jgi:MinD-like ATPase involved in chromosome partitioning or flagellar assembly